MKKVKLFIATASIITLFLSACNKEKIQDIVDSNIMSQDLSTTQSLVEDEESEIINDEIGFRGDCVVKTYSAAQGTYPQTVTLDFGTGCLSKRGHTRKGILTITMSADPKTAGAVVTVLPSSNFFVDDIKVEGTRTWTNLGKDSNGNKSWKREVKGGKLTFPSGKTTSFDASETIKQTAGAGTVLNLTDDVYEISGSRTGTNRNGKTYTATITSPLVKNGECAYIVKGIITISNEDTSRSFDYGDGTCDSVGTAILADGSTRTIQLRRWW